MTRQWKGEGRDRSESSHKIFQGKEVVQSGRAHSVLLMDLILHHHASSEIKCIERSYPIKKGLGQVGILLVQGSISEGLRDFGNPAVDIHVERLRLPGLVLRL
jgi:hypothetical protein